MPTAEEFDEFYVAARRRLFLQTYALTGDLGAARRAVRDAFISARHHWEKVGRSADPESWVRPRAWAAAHRRHLVRPWRMRPDVGEAESRVLVALHELAELGRRALILVDLAGLELPDAGRELGVTQERLSRHLDAARDQFCAALECGTDRIADRLATLDAGVDTIRLPRAAAIRRSGLRRRRRFAVTGAVVTAATVLAAGGFVTHGRTGPVQEADRVPPVTRAMLLTAAGFDPITPAKTHWSVTDTSDNTAGSGINTACQAARFADPAGVAALVRTFTATGTAPATAVQSVEISASPTAAKDAYTTTRGWYADCKAARIQLIDAFKVLGVGDQAEVLRMRIPAKRTRSFLIGLVRTGAVTTSTVVVTRSSQPGSPASLAQVLARSVRALCDSPVAGLCVRAVTTEPTRPPPSGEFPGMLANVDLPALKRISEPWVGTDPVPANANVTATPCDQADFARAKAINPLTRTFLIPQAKLPNRFGLSETVGRFRSERAATAFVDKIIKRVQACPRKELGSTVSHQIIDRRASRRATFAMWRIDSQVNKAEDTIRFWMGVAQVGRSVAQVTMTPVAGADTDEQAFRTMMARARDRLYEVAR